MQKKVYNQFSINTKRAYKNSILPKILCELQKEFKGRKNIIIQLKSLFNLLFLKSRINNDDLDDLSFHMSFAGRIGTGKSSIALKIAQILRDLQYLSIGHLISVTREDLVGEYVGHTAPKTREVLQKSRGGILFIDQSSQISKPNDSKDYGAEAIEIILQVMENQRKDLAVVFSDEKEKLDNFFASNPGISSRIGTHLFFEEYSIRNLTEIFFTLLKKEGGFYLQEELELELPKALKFLKQQPSFSNIRTLELFVHDLIRYQNQRIYRYMKSHHKKLLGIDFLKVKQKDYHETHKTNTNINKLIWR